MEFERDKYFFHYTTREAAFEHILPRGRLRLSRYAEMRDPMEAKWHFMAGGFGDFSDPEQRQQAEGYFAFSRSAAEVLEHSFLLSMTIDAPRDSEELNPFCRGWARPRMWEHYAEKHSGVCLVFEREVFVETLTESLVGQDCPTPHHQPVIYDGDTRQLSMLDLAKLGEGVAQEDVSEYIEANREALFFHKLLDWQSEWEYRFATTCYGVADLFADFGSALIAVIAGKAIPYWQRPAAIAACEAEGAQPLYLDWAATGPRLTELRHRKTRRDEIKAAINKAGDSSLRN